MHVRGNVVLSYSLKVNLESWRQLQNAFEKKHINTYPTSPWGVLWERLVWLKVQWKKPFLKCSYVLAHLRFAQRCANWVVLEWRYIIFSNETKIKRFNSDSRSWCWIGDGECVELQYMSQSVKHGGKLLMILGLYDSFWNGNLVQNWRYNGSKYVHIYSGKTSCSVWSRIIIWFQARWCFSKITIPNTCTRGCKESLHHNHFNFSSDLHNHQIKIS